MMQSIKNKHLELMTALKVAEPSSPTEGVCAFFFWL